MLEASKSFKYKKELEESNLYGKTSEDDIFSIIIRESKHERRLYETLILRKVLEINPDLKLSINSFKPGIEIYEQFGFTPGNQNGAEILEQIFNHHKNDFFSQQVSKCLHSGNFLFLLVSSRCKTIGIHPQKH